MLSIHHHKICWITFHQCLQAGKVKAKSRLAGSGFQWNVVKGIIIINIIILSSLLLIHNDELY